MREQFPPPIQHVPRNRAGRDFVVGDIHGEYDLLMTGLDSAGFNRARDRLFAVGDLVDRGPKSLDCLRLIEEPWFFSVVGNHEDLMFEYMLGRSYCGLRNWIANGGDWWFLHEEDQAARRLVARAFRRLPLALQIDHATGPIGVVHASPPRQWTADDLCDSDTQAHLLWDRRVIRSPALGPDILPAPLTRLYMGHTPQDTPLRRHGLNWIDTGAVYGGPLTIEEL